jgi:hypothetical protein
MIRETYQAQLKYLSTLVTTNSSEANQLPVQKASVGWSVIIYG